MASTRIARIEWGRLEGQRPRHAGSNARIGGHGIAVRPSLARITTDDGSTGIGWSRASREEAQALVGQTFDDLFTATGGPVSTALGIEYPLWDLAGKRVGQPVYALAAQIQGIDPATLASPLRVPAYDTSLYFDDLHIPSEREAAALLASEARSGYDRGHRAFKIKVGRGGRHMPLEEGTRRDVAIVHAVREAVGPGLPIMLDANNGYNLNLTKRVLEETADCGIFWMEEPFHEDVVLYRDLKAWLNERELPVLISDGEGQASPTLMEWAREGAIDVVQYDILSPGFTRWLEIGRQLDAWGRRSAPHHYGAHYGNYAGGHLAGPIRGFTYVEWDEATTPGLDGSAYRIEEGHVVLPNAPGFGLTIDDTAFTRAVADHGYTVSG